MSDEKEREKKPMVFNYPYVWCNRVIDGDTIKVMIDLGFGILKKCSIRFKGIDVYEKTLRDNQTEEEKARGIEATQFLKGEIEKGAVILQVEKDPGKYGGRWIGTVWYYNDQGEKVCLNDLMREKGFNKPGK